MALTGYVVASAALLLFLVGLRLSGLVERMTALAAVGRETLAVIRSDADDAVKEKAAQKAALKSFAAFIAISLRTAVILGVPAGLLWLGARAGLYDLHTVEAAALDWYFIAGSAVVATAALRFLK